MRYVLDQSTRLTAYTMQTDQLDALDQSLLSLLRRDGRASHAALAAALSVTRATVRTRIERLEAKGVILGYAVKLRDEDEQAPVQALTHIRVEGHRTDTVMRRLGGIRWINAIFSTNGKWDLIAEVQAQSNMELDTALVAMREIEGIAESETSILLRKLA